LKLGASRLIQGATIDSRILEAIVKTAKTRNLNTAKGILAEDIELYNEVIREVLIRKVDPSKYGFGIIEKKGAAKRRYLSYKAQKLFGLDT